MSKRKSITTNSSPVKVKFFKSSFEEYAEKEKQKILAEFGNIPSAEIDKELKRRWDKLNVVERENGESGQQPSDINDLEKLASRDSSSEAAPENSRDAPKSNLNEEDTEVPTEFVTQGYLINEKLILRLEPLDLYFDFVKATWRKISSQMKITDPLKLQDFLWRVWNNTKHKESQHAIKSYAIFLLKKDMEKNSGDIEILPYKVASEQWEKLNENRQNLYKAQVIDVCKASLAKLEEWKEAVRREEAEELAKQDAKGTAED